MIEQLKKYRFLLLKKVYEVTKADERIPVDCAKVATDVGVPSDEVSKVVSYLINEGLLSPHGAGRIVVITHEGIKEIEQALTKPNSPTEHFPPVANILIVENMTGSLIQQGTSHSTGSLNFTGNNWNDISSFVSDLKDQIDKLGLDANLKRELTAEIQTVDAQLASPKPKSAIVRETFKSIRTILEGVAGNVIASGLLTKLDQLTSSFF